MNNALALAEPSYALPSLSMLVHGVNRPAQTDSDPAQQLTSILADYGVKGEVTRTLHGPVLTQLLFEPARGTKVRQIMTLSADIARMMCVSSARVTTVPGSTAVSIEIPREQRDKVVLGDILASPAFQDSDYHLPIAVGCDITGAPVIADLAAMPHLLVAGTTGSGKSVGMHAMLLSLLYRMTPDNLRLMLIDPKMLEFSNYDGLPHLLTHVLTTPEKAVDSLEWIVKEMNDRYRRMGSAGVRDIVSYNALQRGLHEAGVGDKIMPRIVVVVDELADLMLAAGKTVEGLIQRIAQKSRAAGIHMILATQRPSTDVITGVIKANLPSRLSFAVTTGTDSRCVLGQMGAEHLLGMGDALLLQGKDLRRVHGAFVSDGEINRVTEFLSDQR